MSTCFTTLEGGVTAAEAAITAVHPHIIQSHILTRLDASTLASLSCTSSKLNTLCKEETLWKDISNASWPSTTDSLLHDVISAFPSGHLSFFSDAYSAVHCHPHGKPSKHNDQTGSLISRLISAVDIHFGEKLICSRVIVTETSTSWFQSTPFRIDLLEPKETVATPVKLNGDESMHLSNIEHQMKLNWILIDPSTKRALNMSSMKPVSVRWNWLSEEIEVRYATVIAVDGSDNGDGESELVQYAVVVTCGGKEGGELHLREVSMHVEDMEGKVWNGKDSLIILEESIQLPRRTKNWDEEKERYEMFLEFKRGRKEKKDRREKRLDMVCVATGITIFLAFWSFVLLR